MKIPRVIYQSWKTKNLPEVLQRNVDEVKRLNPHHEYRFYDDDDCRAYILKNFGPSYAFAFDNLAKGAFKCDFWRYCILSKEGGIYLDIDMVPTVPFDELIESEDEFVSVKDIYPCMIFQAFLACVAQHEAMVNAAVYSFVNVANCRANVDVFDVTGPMVMARALNVYWKRPSSLEDIESGQHGTVKLYPASPYITKDFNGRLIFKHKVDGYTEIANKNGYYRQDKNYFKLVLDNSSTNNDNVIWYYLFAYVVLLVLVALIPVPLWMKLVMALAFIVVLMIAYGIQITYNSPSDDNIIHVRVKSFKEKPNIRIPNGHVHFWSPELLQWYKNDDEIIAYFGGRFIN